MKTPWRRDHNTGLWIEQDELDQVGSLAASAEPNETGGLLVGGRSPKQIWILTALEVPAPIPYPSVYTLEVERANEVLSEYLSHHRLPAHIGYVGTWHSHPAAVGPSPTDMATVTKDSRTQGHTSAGLILSLSAAGAWTPYGIVADGRRRARRVPVSIDPTNPTRKSEI